MAYLQGSLESGNLDLSDTSAKRGEEQVPLPPKSHHVNIM